MKFQTISVRQFSGKKNNFDFRRAAHTDVPRGFIFVFLHCRKRLYHDIIKSNRAECYQSSTRGEL